MNSDQWAMDRFLASCLALLFCSGCTSIVPLKEPYVMISLGFVDMIIEEATDPKQEIKILDSTFEIQPSKAPRPPDYIAKGKGGFSVRGNSCLVERRSIVCNDAHLDTSKGMVVFRSDGTVEVQNFVALVAK